MKYKLLVLDIDGTLTDSKRQITDVTKETLHKLQGKGVRIALASGRPPFGVWPVAKALKLDKYAGYILAYNGGRVEECGTGKIIYEKAIPPEMTGRICELAYIHNVSLLTYKREYLVTETPEDIYVKREADINHMKILKVDSFMGYVDFPIIKCLMMKDGPSLEKVEKAVKAELGDSLSIYRSEPFFLEIMPQNIDKASSLRRLLDYMNIGRDEVVACGDGFNDQTMIELAGIGVAMENGQDAVKGAADCIAPSNDDDGVAFIVNKYMLFGSDEKLRVP